MAIQTNGGIKVLASLAKLEKGSIIHDDYKFFKDIKTTVGENGNVIVSLVTTSPEYFNKWLERTGAQYIDDDKFSLRLDIETKVGDTKERIADAFKFVHILSIALTDIYTHMSDAQKAKLSDTTKGIMDTIIAKRENGYIFQVETKEDINDTVAKLIDRENDIASIFKNEQS